MAVVPREAVDRLRAWKRDPVLFVREMWPGVELEAFQEEALAALVSHGRVSIRSGHGVGKTALDAWAVLWFMSTHYPCKVPCTAPTAHQLEDVLMPEIAQWLAKMPDAFKEQFRLKADRLELVAAPKESFAAFRTGSRHNPEALQGFHSDNLFFLLDEASGIDDSVFEVAEGALSTPGAKVLMTSNPTRTQGYFYASHTDTRARWHCLKVSGFDSSRVSRQYCDDMARYGEDSNIYRVRVLGEFPLADDNAVIPLEWVEAAVDRDVVSTLGRVVWGVDVARYGDDRTALAKRQGNTLLEPIKAWANQDTMTTAGKIMLEYEKAQRKPDDVLVDVIGIGAGVCDRLKEMGLPARGINVAESAAVSRRYMRLRDELWFRGREWFEERACKIPDQSELIGELSSVVYSVSSAGKIQVQSKEQMRRTQKQSPDLADAFLLTFAGSRFERRKKSPVIKPESMRWIV